MGVEIVQPNTCFRGCCSSESIPLCLPSSFYSLLSPIARGNINFFSNLSTHFSSEFYNFFVWCNECAGAESVVYEACLDGKKVAVKKPILSTSQDIDKFHKELQLLWSTFLSFCLFFFVNICSKS